MRHLTSRNVALTAIFAALYYVISYLPGIPAIGVPGVNIQLGACVASVFGLVLGPYLGALAAFVGALVSWALPPGNMGLANLIFLPSPVLNAFLVGLIYNKRWKHAFVILTILTVVFWFLPPAQPTRDYFIIGVSAMWDKILALLLIIPTIMLMEKISQSPAKSTRETSGKNKKTNLAPLLSMLAAVLIIINACMIMINGDTLKFQYDVYAIEFGFKDFVSPMAPYSFLWLLVGAAVLVGAILLHIKPERRLIWGSMVFVFSGISAVIGGGFIVGLILGVLSGFFGVVESKLALSKVSNIEVLVFFLLAFVGNEADNAWGNDVFALPFVYEGIFQMPIEAVRIGFMVSPYAYFVMRFIQALIAAFIAVPLLRSLRGSGLIPELTK
jgi:hypothetical protein